MFGNNNIQFEQNSEKNIACIKVVGVGGGGCNAVNRMIAENVQGVEFWVVNTDAQVLASSKAKNRIIIGKELTKGLGAGADPNKGRDASIESEEEIKEALRGSDMVFIAAGMGGGTGTGSAPVIAKIAKDMGALTIAIVTRPFGFEGAARTSNAAEGLQELKENVDSLIIVSNDKLLEVIGGIPLKDAFQEADKVLRQGVQTITDLIAVPSLINLDFADVRTTMENKGYALIGIGMGKGDNKAEDAAIKAISSPLLEASVMGAQDAIINVTGGDSMTLFEANTAVDIVRQNAGSDINIIFGVAINEQLEDEMIVTVIATGFNEDSIIYADPNVIAQKRMEWKTNLKESLKSRNSQSKMSSYSFMQQGIPTHQPQVPNPTQTQSAINPNLTNRSSKYNAPQQPEQNNNASVEEDDDIPSFLKRR